MYKVVELNIYYQYHEFFPNSAIINKKKQKIRNAQQRNMLADEFEILYGKEGNGFVQKAFQLNILDLPAFVLFRKETVLDMYSLVKMGVNNERVDRNFPF